MFVEEGGGEKGEGSKGEGAEARKKISKAMRGHILQDLVDNYKDFSFTLSEMGNQPLKDCQQKSDWSKVVATQKDTWWE